MPVTIGRTAMTDDDGSGTTGTVFNNAWKTALYDQVDTALAALPQGITHSGTRVTQIAFASAQTASTDANTLDDYEEGTFTPSASFGGSSTGVTASVAVGAYVKIGQLVWFSARITLTSNGTGTGNARITGLPFASNSTGNVFGAISVAYYAALSAATAITGYVENNATTILLQIPGAAATTTAAETNIPDTAELLLAGCYRTAA